MVEALRVELLAQATTLGHHLTADPDLHLAVDGAIVAAQRPDPACHSAPAYHFVLPPHARDVRLVSRTTILAQTRPDSRDTRRLGVAVTRLLLDGKPLALDTPALAGGWLPPEGDWRWTTGNAALPAAGRRELTVSIAQLESYWVRTATTARQAREATLQSAS